LQIKRQLEQRGFCTTACIHAANHAILAMSPLYAQCDITDIDTEHTTVTPALTTPSRLMVCCALHCLCNESNCGIDFLYLLAVIGCVRVVAVFLLLFSCVYDGDAVIRILR
jgi:hypothetical protein